MAGRRTPGYQPRSASLSAEHTQQNPTPSNIDQQSRQLSLKITDGPEQRKLSKAIAEFGGYIRANATAIPNYGERYRNGETVSSAFVESAVNQVVSKRMVKKHHMRWTPRGAHLLLQVRTRVLNDNLAADFQRWYSAFVAPSPSNNAALAA